MPYELHLTNKLRKIIRSLDKKKFRNQYGLFVAEGKKIVQDLLKSSFQTEYIIGTEQSIQDLNLEVNYNVIVVDEEVYRRISFQRAPQNIMALVRIRQWLFDPLSLAKNNLILVLDDIQDPGNLGTILRIADWYGIAAVIASQATADIYNPKTVQASMGSIFRVPIAYYDLTKILAQAKELPIWGTFMEGENIYTSALSNNGFIIMGNEGNGISSEVSNIVNRRLTIPSFNNNNQTDSLNVAIATAIIVSEFKRRLI